MSVRRVLPLAAVYPVHLLREMIPPQHIPPIGIKFNKLSIDEGIETRNIRAHTESGHLLRGQMEGIGLSLHGAGKVQPRSVQTKLTFSTDDRGIVSLEIFILRQLTHANVATVCKVRILYIFLCLFPLQ